MFFDQGNCLIDKRVTLGLAPDSTPVVLFHGVAPASIVQRREQAVVNGPEGRALRTWSALSWFDFQGHGQVGME